MGLYYDKGLFWWSSTRGGLTFGGVYSRGGGLFTKFYGIGTEAATRGVL